jgi:hypothetical protein
LQLRLRGAGTHVLQHVHVHGHRHGRHNPRRCGMCAARGVLACCAHLARRPRRLLVCGLLVCGLACLWALQTKTGRVGPGVVGRPCEAGGLVVGEVCSGLGCGWLAARFNVQSQCPVLGWSAVGWMDVMSFVTTFSGHPHTTRNATSSPRQLKSPPSRLRTRVRAHSKISISVSD